jgi:hypothetical protein
MSYILKLLCGGPRPATHEDAVDAWALLPGKLASGLLRHLTHEDAVERVDRSIQEEGVLLTTMNE